MLIDLHAHHITKDMFDQDEHWGPFWEGTIRVGGWTLGTTNPLAPTIDEVVEKRWAAGPRLEAMDAAGVDKFVFSMPLHLVMYHASPEFNTRYSATVNESLAQFCSAAPDRFTYWAHAPLQDPAAAAKEIDRAVTHLGAQGLSMGGANFGGLEVHMREMYPIWEKISELDVPIFVHGYNQSVTWDDAGRPDTFDTTSIIGMNSDEALFYWYTTNGGVLDDFPDLKIIITHGGGFVPFQLGRFNETNKTMAPDSRNKKELIEYNKNFFYDLDIQSPIMRKAIVDEVGVDHVVYGTNFGGADSHDGELTADMGLSDPDREKIRSGNALKMFPNLK